MTSGERRLAERLKQKLDDDYLFETCKEVAQAVSVEFRRNLTHLAQ